MTARISAKLVGLVLAGGLLGLASTAQAASQDTVRLQKEWQATIAHTPTPNGGCFTASYPLTVWRQVKCVKGPSIAYIPRSGTNSGAQTTGDGHDYAGVTKKITLDATGSFPKVKHLTSETDGGRANVYSLQLNSNFMSGNQGCATANVPANCVDWLQYVYSSSEHAAFMQYWLIDYTGGTVHCPSGWNSFSTDCFKNSAAVQVPLLPITELPNISIAGSAVAGGLDTLVMTTATQAYTTTGQDSVVFLATGWHESEWNVIGDGGGSAATFNAGAKLTAKINLNDGTTKKPTCPNDHGTTGETNNLNLGACIVKGGAAPFVQFTESD